MSRLPYDQLHRLVDKPLGGHVSQGLDDRLSQVRSHVTERISEALGPRDDIGDCIAQAVGSIAKCARHEVRGLLRVILCILHVGFPCGAGSRHPVPLGLKSSIVVCLQLLQHLLMVFLLSLKFLLVLVVAHPDRSVCVAVGKIPAGLGVTVILLVQLVEQPPLAIAHPHPEDFALPFELEIAQALVHRGLDLSEPLHERIGRVHCGVERLGRPLDSLRILLACDLSPVLQGVEGLDVLPVLVRRSRGRVDLLLEVPIPLLSLLQPLRRVLQQVLLGLGRGIRLVHGSGIGQGAFFIVRT